MAEEAYEKACTKCGEVKPRSEFRADNRQCRGCQRKAQEWRDRNRERNREIQRRYRRANREKIRAADRRYRRVNHEKIQAGIRDWQLRNPEKVRAHRALERALLRGEIVRPDACEGCGEQEALHGHHDDYAKPLEVRWLCAHCHRDHHATLARDA